MEVFEQLHFQGVPVLSEVGCAVFVCVRSNACGPQHAGNCTLVVPAIGDDEISSVAPFYPTAHEVGEGAVFLGNKAHSNGRVLDGVHV